MRPLYSWDTYIRRNDVPCVVSSLCVHQDLQGMLSRAPSPDCKDCDRHWWPCLACMLLFKNLRYYSQSLQIVSVSLLLVGCWKIFCQHSQTPVLCCLSSWARLNCWSEASWEGTSEEFLDDDINFTSGHWLDEVTASLYHNHSMQFVEQLSRPVWASQALLVSQFLLSRVSALSQWWYCLHPAERLVSRPTCWDNWLQWAHHSICLPNLSYHYFACFQRCWTFLVKTNVNENWCDKAGPEA